MMTQRPLNQASAAPRGMEAEGICDHVMPPSVERIRVPSVATSIHSVPFHARSAQVFAGMPGTVAKDAPSVDRSTVFAAEKEPSRARTAEPPATTL